MLRQVLHRLNERRESVQEDGLSDPVVKKSWEMYGKGVLHAVGSLLPHEMREVVDPKYYGFSYLWVDAYSRPSSTNLVPSLSIESKMNSEAFPPFRRAERFFDLSLSYIRFWKSEASEGYSDVEHVEGNRFKEAQVGRRFVYFLLHEVIRVVEREARLSLNLHNLFATTTPIILEVSAPSAPHFNFKELAPESISG